MLKAGTAAVTITPERPAYMQGYGNRMGVATGTLDPLEARVIALDDGTTSAAIVSVDLLGLDATSVARIRDAAAHAGPIPADNVIVVCSHTHGGPAIQTMSGVPIDQEYLGWLERRLGEAVGEAAASMAPVTVGAGEGRADFNVNRRLRRPDGSVGGANPVGAVDRRVRVLRFDRADAPDAPGTLGGRTMPQGDPVAVLFSFACHATTLTSANLPLQRRLPRGRPPLRRVGLRAERHRRRLPAGVLRRRQAPPAGPGRRVQGRVRPRAYGAGAHPRQRGSRSRRAAGVRARGRHRRREPRGRAAVLPRARRGRASRRDRP